MQPTETKKIINKINNYFLNNIRTFNTDIYFAKFWEKSNYCRAKV